MSKRITQDDWDNRVSSLVGDEYTFHDKYTKSNVKLSVTHNLCGHTYYVTPNKFTGGRRCPKCSGTLRKDDSYFKKEVLELVGDEYTFIGTYKGAHTKIKAKHNDCGYEWYVTPDSFLNAKSRCPKCSGNVPLTLEEFKNKIYKIVGDEYSVIGNYVKDETKVEMKHNKCGHVWKVKGSRFIRENVRCPKCNIANRTRTQEEWDLLVRDSVGNEYVFKEKYKNSTTSIAVEHELCGFEYKTTPAIFIKGGGRCPRCCSKTYKDDYIFKEEVYSLVGDEYTFTDEYVDNKTKLTITHNKCNYSYSIEPGNFLAGRRCPRCNGSEYEIEIADILDKYNVKYVREKTFDDLKIDKHLRCDFYLPKNNTIIEFDGKQHLYDDTIIFRDTIKNKYAYDNGINMVRIPYSKKEELESLLIKELNL